VISVAVEGLQTAVRKAGFVPRSLRLADYRTRPPLPHSLSTTVIAGRISEIAALFPEHEFAELPPDSFRIAVLPQRMVVIAGSDTRGTAYGCMALAEKVMTGRDPGGVEAVTRSPVFDFRGIPVPAAVVRPENEDWLNSEDYWRALYADLVADRWNSVLLPPDLILPPGETGTESLAPACRLAEEFDLRAIADLETAGGPEEHGVLLRRLVGRNAVAGVRFSLSGDDIRDGSSEALRALSAVSPGFQIHFRIPPDVRPADMERLLSRIKSDAVFVWPSSDLDLSEWKDYVAEKSPPVGIVCQLPRLPFSITRWGDPDYADEIVKRARDAGATGISMPRDEWLFGPDRTGTENHDEKCRNWTYLHEKRWFSLWVWGKCAYDGAIDRETPQALFTSRFGEAVGPAMLQSQISASRILVALADFFPALQVPGLFLEGSWLGMVKPLPAEEGTPPAAGDALSVRAFAEMAVNPGTSIGVPELIGMEMAGLRVSRDRRTDPRELADRLTDLAHGCRESARVSYRQEYSPVDLQESRSYDLELQLLSNLGRYYARLLWAAIVEVAPRAGGELDFGVATGETMEGVEREWGFVTRLTELLYLPLQTGDGKSFHWNLVLDRIAEEAAGAGDASPEVIPRQIAWKVVGPIPFQTRHLATFEKICSSTVAFDSGLGVATVAKDLAWMDLTTTVLDAPPGEVLPLWAERVNRYARFVNMRRAYPRAVEGVGFAWRKIASGNGGEWVLECPVESPEKVWMNGEEVYHRPESGESFPEEGVGIQLEPGENDLVFRSDLKRDGTPYWGAAPYVRPKVEP
jgi:hypothetical protein